MNINMKGGRMILPPFILIPEPIFDPDILHFWSSAFFSRIILSCRHTKYTILLEPGECGDIL
jgi:hypothetical protein